MPVSLISGHENMAMTNGTIPQTSSNLMMDFKGQFIFDSGEKKTTKSAHVIKIYKIIVTNK